MRIYIYQGIYKMFLSEEMQKFCLKSNIDHSFKIIVTIFCLNDIVFHDWCNVGCIDFRGASVGTIWVRHA